MAVLMVILSVSNFSCQRGPEDSDEPRKVQLTFKLNGEEASYDLFGIIAWGVPDTLNLIGLQYYEKDGLEEDYNQFLVASVPMHRGEFPISKERELTSDQIRILLQKMDTTKVGREVCDQFFVFNPMGFDNILTVEEVDRKEKIISGSFQLNLFREVECGQFSGPDTIQITEGDFFLRDWTDHNEN